jgi:hypothetical protein
VTQTHWQRHCWWLWQMQGSQRELELHPQAAYSVLLHLHLPETPSPSQPRSLHSSFAWPPAQQLMHL